jgi:hypothetical protein
MRDRGDGHDVGALLDQLAAPHPPDGPVLAPPTDPPPPGNGHQRGQRPAHGRTFELLAPKDAGRPVAAPLARCAELLGRPLAEVAHAAQQLEPYWRADGAAVWSLLHLERQLGLVRPARRQRPGEGWRGSRPRVTAAGEQ